MTVIKEASRISNEIKSFAKRNPDASYNMKSEVGGMLEFLIWASYALPQVYIRDGGELFKIYDMKDKGAQWN